MINSFDDSESVSGVKYEVKDNGDIIYTIPCDIKPIRILVESNKEKEIKNEEN